MCNAEHGRNTSDGNNTNDMDDAIAAIHQRQQELLRASMKNDQVMDVQQQGGMHFTAQHLLQSPLFSISMGGITDLMHESRSMGGGNGAGDSELMYYVDDHHGGYDDDVGFDTIRSHDMREIMNMPVDDTLRSEELNFLLNEPMEEE
jgi:hypothetical protein